jgi:hypothetical protein
VADALRARQHRIEELRRLERVGVAPADHLEPFHCVSRRVLDARDIDATNLLISRERLRDTLDRMASCVKLSRKLDGVIESKLGARTDGEMSGMGGVSHQYDMRAPVKAAPLAADQPIEIEPGRSPHVTRIGHELRAVEGLGKKLLAKRDRGILVELAQPVRLEGLVSRLDYEGRSVAIKLINVGLEPAVLGLAEVEGERVERLGDAEPDVAIGADEKIGPELIGVPVTDPRIETIGRDDEVGFREFDVGINLALECELDAKHLATSLQDIQQLLAPDANKAVTGRSLPRTLEHELDVVPMIERVGDLRRAFRVCGAHRAHHRVGKDDAPAKRVIGLVALDHGHCVLWPELFHQEPEIEPGRAAADADDAHIVLASAFYRASIFASI